MAYEALYRRYRPSRFGDAFFGQPHVVAALRNAVEGDRVGHAYLFSGPRGTGKTTSARILAKALNCTDLQAGEPCDACESCQAFNSGSSYDLHELDAASNNGVDAMRDLIAKVALGSPGRTKVYILDEVHMLSSGAENALLKTLEEPPPHVVFVLCTTEPNKVVPTIRSRTQHLEFSLLNHDDVNQLIDHVVGDAGIEISTEDRAYVIRSGGGSARDTLSALDQVVAAGGAPEGGEHFDRLIAALAERDAEACLEAIDAALQAGRDPATIATAVLAELRNVFLVTMRADLGHLPQAEAERASQVAASMSPARITRAVEVIGAAVIEMRQAPDPRVDLEVAFMRLTRPDLDVDPRALLERIEALEAGGVSGGVAAASPAEVTVQSPAAAAPDAGRAGRAAESGRAPMAHGAPTEEPPPTEGRATVAPDQSQPSQAPSAGKRGADIARAALAAQQSARSGSSSPPPTATGADTQAVQAPGAEAQASPPQTLADRRAARQSAQASSDESSQPGAPPEQSPPAQHAPEPEQSPPAQHAPEPEQSPPAQPDRSPSPQASPQPAEAPGAAATGPAPSAAGAIPSVTALETAWKESILAAMPGRVRSRFSAGHFLPSEPDTAVFGLPNPVHRDRCEEVRAEVDAALQAKFGAPVPLRLVVDDSEVEPDFLDAAPSAGGPTPEAATAAEEAIDLGALVDADDEPTSHIDRVLSTFEGSVVVDQPTSPETPDGR